MESQPRGDDFPLGWAYQAPHLHQENLSRTSNQYIIGAEEILMNPSATGNDSISANLCRFMFGSRGGASGTGFHQRSHEDLLLFFHLSAFRFCFGLSLRDSFDVQNRCKAILCIERILPGLDKDWNGSGIKLEDFQVLPPS